LCLGTTAIRLNGMMHDQLEKFRPHPLLPGGHAQTLLAAWLPWRRVPYRAAQHRVRLSDGDSLVVHDDCPPEWKPGERVALLMHGLGGSYESGYMVRVSQRLFERGLRTFRLDLRGAGAGADCARRSYHAGCSSDVLEVLQFLRTLCPGSAICPIGFSLSGNIILKLLGEWPEAAAEIVDRAIAVNPPIDLRRSVQELSRLANRFYDRHFVSVLHRSVLQRRQSMPDAAIPQTYDRPRRLYDFDDQYTARVAGFENAEEYYARCSAAQFLKSIVVPTEILTSLDDPLVPVSSFDGVLLPDTVRLHVAEGGGHLGYFAAAGTDPDRRWMDWRVVNWVQSD